MRRALRYFGYVLAGLGFWIPSVLFHAIRSGNFGASRLDTLAVLIMPVAASLLVRELLYWWQGALSRRGTIALWMLLGIWVFGPLCVTAGATFSGGGFSQPQAWYLLLIGIPLFVPMTFMMSTYDGTLGALGVVTVWFIISGLIRLLRRHPSHQEPPATSAL